jgi:hypothetical protein
MWRPAFMDAEFQAVPERLSAEERIDDLRPHDDPQHSSTNAPR